MKQRLETSYCKMLLRLKHTVQPGISHFFSFPNLCPATPTKTKGSAQVLELGTAVTACIRREVVVRWSWDFKECGGISPLLAYAMFTDDSDMISLGKLVVWSVYKGFSLLFCFLSIDAKCG